MQVQSLGKLATFATISCITLASAGAKERVIFDTDVGGDVDDAGALAVLYALADKGEIDILAIGVVIGHPAGVPFVDAVNTWYGRPNLPVGTIKGKAPYNRDEYMLSVLAEYPHDLTQETAPDVVKLYRQVLATEPDRSVTMIAIGPATNIRNLLESKPDEYSPLTGVELVRKKVKFYAAGGNGDAGLPDGKCGFNYATDIKAAQGELALLPSDFPTVFAGGSGKTLKVGSCYRRAKADHIIRRSYEAYYKGEAEDRMTWDQLRVLYACRPSVRKLWDTSAPGTITVDKDRNLKWTETPNANRAYAYVNDMEAMRTQLTELMMYDPREKAKPPAAQHLSFPWPPAAGQIRVIIDADADNEIDDQWAIALALGFPERINIEGFVAAHYGQKGASDGIAKSYASIEETLAAAGRTGKYTIKRGSDPLVYRDRISESEGIDFIIEKARAATPENPIWLVLLGPATDAVAALTKDPSIADRVVVFWHGRSAWPEKCMNFNATNDPLSTQLLFKLPCRMVLFDTGTDLTMPMEECGQRVKTVGPLGKFLYEIRANLKWTTDPKKGIFDLGDIAALIDPAATCKWEKVEAPGVDADYRYNFTKTFGPIIRIYSIDRDASFALLDQALARLEKSVTKP